MRIVLRIFPDAAPSVGHIIILLFYYTTRYNIMYNCYYVNTLSNDAADAISRHKWSVFRKVCPDADVLITDPIDIILDF